MAVVVVSEVAVAAGGDVSQVGGASLRLEVAVDLAGHHRGGGAGVALRQGLQGGGRNKNMLCSMTCGGEQLEE